MKTSVLKTERKKYPITINKCLAELLCYSCQEHNRCAWDDKHISVDDNIRILIFADGRCEVWSMEELDQEICDLLLSEINSISRNCAESFGDGISVTILNKKVECSSCGSEEFII